MCSALATVSWAPYLWRLRVWPAGKIAAKFETGWVMGTTGFCEGAETSRNCLNYTALSLFNVSYACVLTPWSRVLPEKLTGPQPVKKFPAFYGTQSFITAFTRARQLSLSWARSIQYMPPSHFSRIHFNVILPSMPGSSKWPPSLRFRY